MKPSAAPEGASHQSTPIVLARDEVAEGVVMLEVGHRDRRRLPDWTPGSHIDLILPDGAVRQYSLCGDRWDPYRYRVAVLREPAGRGGSAYIHDRLRPGDPVGIGGPRNHFALAPANRYLFVAGGIGITPILPMLTQAELLGIDWQLLYGGRTRASMAFAEELVERHGDRVRLHPEDEAGLLPLDDFLGNPATGTKVYCCGPTGLLTALDAATSAWPPGTVRTERFVADELSVPVRREPFEVELAQSGKVLTVEPDMTVLEAVRAVGVNIVSSCEQGICGTCEVDVLAGEPDHRDALLDDDERHGGHSMFICVSRSCGPRLTLDL